MDILIPGDKMNESIWMEQIQLPHFPPLQEDRRTEVLIIGGGLAGLLCAYKLRSVGIDCILIEADRLCGGATGRTTAKITSQHGLVYHKLCTTFGEETAKGYWMANEAAVGEFAAMAERIPCDFEVKTSWLYCTAPNRALDAEAEALVRLGIPHQTAQTLDLPFPVRKAIGFGDQAQFHPLKFAAGLLEGLEIYEQTPAREFLGNGVKTDHAVIRAENILVATHFPILNKHGSFFLKLYQQRSYVLAVADAVDVKGMYLGVEKGSVSLRNQGNLLFIGGGSHRTGKKTAGWAPLEAFARETFPHSPIAARWANQDCMTLDGLPYIGQYSTQTPKFLVAAGFQKWGMTGSMAASSVLTDRIRGLKNPYEAMFSPQRSILHPQLAVNGLESMVSLLTPTAPRCPHLGCALKWNSRERSWDCPCHGSRFSEEGKLLNDPATDDLPETDHRQK